jgi:hypothetical protein
MSCTTAAVGHDLANEVERTVADIASRILAVSRRLVALGARLSGEELSQYQRRVADRLRAPAVLGGTLSSAVRGARQLVFICGRGRRCAACGAPSAVRISTLTRSCGIWPSADACARHAVAADAFHLLLTLPERASDGGPWTEAGVRAAVRFLVRDCGAVAVQ